MITDIPEDSRRMGAFVNAAEKYWREFPRQRRGQAYLGFVACHLPRLADEIRETEVDPSVDDQRLPDFLLWMVGQWRGEHDND